jgi:putative SOS response-associated peptidase YedK
MTFAGLWDEWKNKATGEVLKSCTMLITEPNDFVAEVHDRMPVVLESKDFAPSLPTGIQLRRLAMLIHARSTCFPFMSPSARRATIRGGGC